MKVLAGDFHRYRWSTRVDQICRFLQVCAESAHFKIQKGGEWQKASLLRKLLCLKSKLSIPICFANLRAICDFPTPGAPIISAFVDLTGFVSSWKFLHDWSRLAILSLLYLSKAMQPSIADIPRQI